MALMKETIIRGDDEEWTIALTDSATPPLPLPLRSLQIQIVAKPPGSDLANDSDALYRHTATFAGDGTLTNAVGIRLGGGVGIITEFLTPADVVALATAYDALAGKDPRILANWDVQVRDALGRHKTVLSGQLSMTRDIGRVRDIA